MKKFFRLLPLLALFAFPAHAQLVNSQTVGADPCANSTLSKFTFPLSITSAATYTLVPGSIDGKAFHLCGFHASVVGTNPTLAFGTALGPVPTPGIGTFTTATTGGTLLASTSYCYRVTGTNNSGAGETLPSAEACFTTGASTATNTITISATVFQGATGCNVYGRTAGAELKLTTGTLANGVCTYTDTNGATPSGALPTANTTAVNATACVVLTGTIPVPTTTILHLADFGSTLGTNPGGTLCLVAGGTITGIQGFFYGVRQ